MKAQAAKVSHAQMNIYRHQPMLDLSDKLAEIVPEGMDTFVYTNSGAEAVENAVKLAKQVTRRPGIIAFQGAFHGRTHLTMALTDSAVHYRGHHEPLVGGIYHARYCYPYRTPASEDPTAYAIEDVRRVLRAEIYGDDVAAIIVEPIQGEGGFIVPTKEFMHELRAIADEIGAMLIIDEIQAGMGRTGTWFCREHYGVKPDIMTIAKGIASGYPLGVVAAPKDLWDKCLPGSMGGTYGGNAVACAAGVATIDAMRDEGMLANAARQGDKLKTFFEELQPAHPCIGEVRGKGLMLAIECVQAGHQGRRCGRGQGVHRRVQQAEADPHGRRLARQLRALPAAAQHLRRRHRHRRWASSTRPPRWRSPERAACLRRSSEGRGAAAPRPSGVSSHARRRATLRAMSPPESPAPRFTTRVRVRYAETDAAGVVYYGELPHLLRGRARRAAPRPRPPHHLDRGAGRAPAGGRGAPQVLAAGAPRRSARGVGERRVHRPGLVRLRLRGLPRRSPAGQRLDAPGRLRARHGPRHAHAGLAARPV